MLPTYVRLSNRNIRKMRDISTAYKQYYKHYTALQRVRVRVSLVKNELVIFGVFETSFIILTNIVNQFDCFNEKINDNRNSQNHRRNQKLQTSRKSFFSVSHWRVKVFCLCRAVYQGVLAVFAGITLKTPCICLKHLVPTTWIFILAFKVYATKLLKDYKCNYLQILTYQSL